MQPSLATGGPGAHYVKEHKHSIDYWLFYIVAIAAALFVTRILMAEGSAQAAVMCTVDMLH